MKRTIFIHSEKNQELFYCKYLTYQIWQKYQSKSILFFNVWRTRLKILKVLLREQSKLIFYIKKIRKIRENPGKSGKIRENPRQSGEIRGKPGETGGNRENPWKSGTVRDNPRKSRKIRENTRRSGEIRGNSGKSWKILENPGKFRNVQKILGQTGRYRAWRRS